LAARRAATYGITVERTTLRADGFAETTTAKPSLLVPCPDAQWEGGMGGVCGSFGQALTGMRTEVWSWPGGNDCNRRPGSRPPALSQEVARQGDISVRQAAGEDPSLLSPTRNRCDGCLCTWEVLARPGQGMCFGIAAGGTMTITGPGERHIVLATRPLWVRLVIPRSAGIRTAALGFQDETRIRVEQGDGDPWITGTAPQPLPWNLARTLNLLPSGPTNGMPPPYPHRRPRARKH